MKSIEVRLPQEIDKSFVVFREKGSYFPCPWHYHPEYELVLILKSSGKRMVGDHIGYFQEGDLVCMGPYLPHVWVNDAHYFTGTAKEEADAIVIHFREDFLGKDFLDIPEMEGLKSFFSHTKRGMVLKGPTRDQLSALMVGMLNMNGLQRLSSLLSIFDILSQTQDYQLLSSPRQADFPVPKNDRFTKINQFILEHFDEDISLPQVAQVANMAVTTFCNFFKEQYRMTFVEYLNAVRIGHACKLLSLNDQNIVDVAYACGFNNLANFNRQFKKHKKMTPTAYRKTVNIAQVA
ncbi:MAG TPA: AraC family transcriptional regulator [Cyclobacteriaceae bacterium]|nr:AraC family transcriptional regulator [Cyclobacteriaceae bacterium]